MHTDTYRGIQIHISRLWPKLEKKVDILIQHIEKSLFVACDSLFPKVCSYIPFSSFGVVTHIKKPRENTSTDKTLGRRANNFYSVTQVCKISAQSSSISHEILALQIQSTTGYLRWVFYTWYLTFIVFCFRGREF